MVNLQEKDVTLGPTPPPPPLENVTLFRFLQITKKYVTLAATPPPHL